MSEQEPTGHERIARDLTHAIMRHYRYTDEAIVAAEYPVNHQSAGCEWAGDRWDCDDENGRPNHPDHDELWRTANLVVDVVVPFIASGLRTPTQPVERGDGDGGRDRG